MQRYHLDELYVGQRFTSASVTVDAEEVKAFAAKYDPQPFHLDDDAAKDSIFGGLAASGWHTGAMSMNLLVTSGLPLAGGIVGAGTELTWPHPVRPGDVLTVFSDVVAIVPSRSKPDRGIVTVRSETRNQHGTVVQVMTGKLVVPKKPQAAD